MFSPWAKLHLVLLLHLCGTPMVAEPTVFSDPLKNLDQWVVEQMPGGTVEARDGVLFIHDVGGCTVWFRQKLTAPVSIKYDAVVRSTGRISDLNCFWMASDPTRPADLFSASPRRSGKFAEYDALQTYYVGFGGNSNSTTRFRRYQGGGAKPLLAEHDLRESRFLLEADHLYQIELIVEDGVVKFIRDGDVLFTFRDHQPLTSGWFGLRTVDATIEIKNFRVFARGATVSGSPP